MTDDVSQPLVCARCSERAAFRERIHRLSLAARQATGADGSGQAERQSPVGRCSLCRAIVSLGSAAHPLALDKLRQQRREILRDEQALAEKRACLARQEAERLVSASGCASTCDLPAAFPVPANRRPLTVPPPHRRRNVHAHMARLIRRGDRADSVAAEREECQANGCDASDPEPFALLACATCRGRCCVHGGDEGYITLEVLDRYAATRPGTERHVAAEAFEARVPSETYQNSCIYHTEYGCSLPREMRADTCNTFECQELRELSSLRADTLFGSDVALVAIDGDGVMDSKWFGCLPSSDRRSAPGLSP